MTDRLELSGSAVASAAGVATVFLPLVPFGERWVINSLSCLSTSALRSAFNVYRNAVSQPTFLDGVTISGNKNTTDTVMRLEPNDRLVCQWTNATPGSVCTVTAEGSKATR